VKTFAAVRDLAAEAPVDATVRGGSMAPLFKDGDRVRIARARLYLPGDVVAFRADDGRIVAHRLLGYRLHHGRLAGVTRGDAVSQPDPPVPFGQLLGRVVSHPGHAPLVPWGARRGAAAAFLRLVVRRILRRWVR
jgi:signal peptidase I